MAHGAVKSFYGTHLDVVVAAAINAVCVCGYKIDCIDKANGLITFKSGMSWKSWAGQEMSIMVHEFANGTVEVVFAGWRIQSVLFQLFDWFEASGIAERVISEMTDALQGQVIQKVINRQSF